MDRQGRRLAKLLSRLIAVLLGLSVIGIVLLIPGALVAFIWPESLAGDYTARVNGIPVDVAQPFVAGTVLLLGVAFLAAMLVVLLALRRVMTSVVDGEPFVMANVGRLRTIAGAMAALLIGQILTGFILPAQLRQAGEIHGGFNVGLFLGVLTVLVLAEVFREGVRLREDAEGTI